MHTIEQARLDDHAELLDFLVRVFRRDNPYHLRFEELYPDLYPPTAEACGHHHVVRDRGRIVAAIGLYPLTLQLGAARLRVAGIGAVSTDPAHAGRGMMSALLTHIWTVMRRERYPLSWLGGRRDRYARYGWERAGAAVVYTLDRRSAGGVPPAWRVASHEPGDLAALPEGLWAVREAHGVRACCDAAEWLLHLRRTGLRLIVARREAETAYGVWHWPSRTLQEWGGSHEGVQALLAHLAAEGVLTVTIVPELEPELAARLRSQAVGIGGAVCDALAVVDLPALAEAYAPWLRARWPAGRALHLAMVAAGRTLSEVWLADGAPTARPVSGAASVALPLLDMARFVLGPGRAAEIAGLGGGDRWVDQVFPLPFHLAGDFHV